MSHNIYRYGMSGQGKFLECEDRQDPETGILSQRQHLKEPAAERPILVVKQTLSARDDKWAQDCSDSQAPPKLAPSNS